LDWLLDAIDKSLLLLFFRKEVLSCLFSLSPTWAVTFFEKKKQKTFALLCTFS